MHVNELSDHRQTYTEATFSAREGTLFLHKQVENDRYQVGRHADARVLDADQGPVIFLLQCNLDPASVRRVFDGIVQEVQNDLRKPDAPACGRPGASCLARSPHSR